MDQHAAIWTALDAVAQRWGRRFTELDIPDEKERQRPAVDLLVEDDEGQHWVFEHTVVESFPGRIFDDSLFSSLAKCVEEGLSGSLPKPGQYRVTLDPGGLTRRIDIDDICAAVSTWATSVADSLAIGSPLTAPAHVANTVLAPWEVSVWLARWPGHDGRVLAMRSIPENLIALREERIATALDKKCPKLQEATRHGELASLLLLESDDLALGNYPEIAEATVRGLANRSDVPDVICLIETDVDADVWLIKEHEAVYPEVCDPGPMPAPS
jgi:hypothetical protein